jgi:hypothetical protein
MVAALRAGTPGSCWLADSGRNEITLEPEPLIAGPLLDLVRKEL